VATSFAAKPGTPVPPWVVALLAPGDAAVAAETRVRGLDAGAGVDDWPAGGESRGRRWGNGASYDRMASGSTQFLSRDPLAAVTRRPYAYTGDNPLDAADPTGLDPSRWEGLPTQSAQRAAKLERVLRELNSKIMDLRDDESLNDFYRTDPAEYDRHVQTIIELQENVERRAEDLSVRCPEAYSQLEGDVKGVLGYDPVAERGWAIQVAEQEAKEVAQAEAQIEAAQAQAQAEAQASEAEAEAFAEAEAMAEGEAAAMAAEEP